MNITYDNHVLSIFNENDKKVFSADLNYDNEQIDCSNIVIHEESSKYLIKDYVEQLILESNVDIEDEKIIHVVNEIYNDKMISSKYFNINNIKSKVSEFTDFFNEAAIANKEYTSKERNIATDIVTAYISNRWAKCDTIDLGLPRIQRLASKYGYKHKAYNIKLAIQKLNSSDTDKIKYYVTMNNDNNNIKTVVIYFNFYIENDIYQLSFHLKRHVVTKDMDNVEAIAIKKEQTDFDEIMKYYQKTERLTHISDLRKSACSAATKLIEYYNIS